MTYNGVIQKGLDRGKRIPGQLTEMTLGTIPSIPMQMSVNPPQKSHGGDKIVDLFLEVDRSNPQFMAINGQIGNMKLPVGRIHNTNLGNQNGLRHTFTEVKHSVRRSMGLSESDEVFFGDFTWRENLVPYTIEKMIAEALDYSGIDLTGKFGPAKSIGTQKLIRETKWFSQPSMHIHDEVTIDEALDLKNLPAAVKKEISAILRTYQKQRNKGKTLEALKKALKGSVKDAGAAAKYLVRMFGAGAAGGVGAAGGLTAASYGLAKAAPFVLPLLADVNKGPAQDLTEDAHEVVLACPECRGHFIVTEDAINEDEDGSFVVCPHCHEEAEIDEVTRADVGAAFRKGLELAGQAGSGVRKQLSKGKEAAVRTVTGAGSKVYKAFRAFKPGKTKTEVGEDLDEASALLTLGGSKPVKGYKRFPVGQGKIWSAGVGFRKAKFGIIPTASFSTRPATKYLQIPKGVKNKVSAAYAVGKHTGAQEATKRIKVTGLAMALGTLLGIAGFKKMLGTKTYANIKAKTAEFVNSKIKGQDIGTEEQVTNAINTVTELPRVRWKLKNVAHTLQTAKPEQRQKAIDKAAMEIGLIVLKEMGL